MLIDRITIFLLNIKKITGNNIVKVGNEIVEEEAKKKYWFENW